MATASKYESYQAFLKEFEDKEKHVAIWQIMRSSDSFPDEVFSNDYANLFFERQRDPNFIKLCQDYETNPVPYKKKFLNNTIWIAPVEPKKITLYMFIALFNEDWTFSENEHIPVVYPRFVEPLTIDDDTLEVERWTQREMFTNNSVITQMNIHHGEILKRLKQNKKNVEGLCTKRFLEQFMQLYSGEAVVLDTDDFETYQKIAREEMDKYEQMSSGYESDDSNEPMPKNCRKNGRVARKQKRESKNVKSVTVTQGNAEEYDIDKVVQSLENENSSTKRKPKKKKSKKKRAENPENVTENVPESSKDVNENISESTETDESSEPLESVNHQTEALEPKLEESEEFECTICFCCREQTFAIIPCGHATFCGDCSLRICNDRKRCPTCQTETEGRLRIFQ